jgi:hypothetical protein
MVETHVNILRVNVENYTATRIIEGTHKSPTYRAKPYIARVLAISALFLFGSTIGLSTTIVAIRTPTDVSIAADSIATFQSAAPESVCKIYRAGTIFFGVAGMDHDPVTKFNVSTIISKAIRTTQDFNKKMASTERALVPAFRVEMISLKSTRPKEFDIARQNGVSVTFVGFENAIPFVIAQSFVVSVTPTGDILVIPSKVKRCPGQECPDGFYITRMGITEVIEKYIAISRTEHITPWQFAAKLVQLEIDDTKAKTVGPPIDILNITAKGPEWISQKAGCPIITTAPRSRATKAAK